MTFFTEEVCCKCHQPFGMPSDAQELLRRNHQTFYCLWGHPQHYSEGESDETKLRRERDRLKQDAARLQQRIDEERLSREAAERRVSAAKGQITKLKKRSAEGQCPCCNRVFVDLLSHMKSKHAEYEAEPIDLDGVAEESTQAAA